MGQDDHKRIPRPVSEEYLFRAGVHYLERYASSTANLERILARKAEKRARLRGEEGNSHEALVEAAVAKIRELGLLNDEAYAQSRLDSLRRRGTSRRHVAGKLGAKGVPREIVERVMAADETDEASAARRHAQRRRLGPYGSNDPSLKRDRDLASLMRAGFSYSHALQALEPVDDES